MMKTDSLKDKVKLQHAYRAQKIESFSFIMLLWVIYAHSHGDVRAQDHHWFWLLTMRSGCGITFFYVASGFHTHETWKSSVWRSEWDMLEFFVRRFTPALLVVFIANTFEAWQWRDPSQSWGDILMSSFMLDRFLGPMDKMPAATPLWTMQVLAVFWACYPLMKLALQAADEAFVAWNVVPKTQNRIYGALCVLILLFSAQQWNLILDTGASYDLHRRSVLMTWPSFLFGMLVNHIHRRLPQHDIWIYVPDIAFFILFILLITAPCSEPCDVVVTGWMYHMVEGPISTFLFSMSIVGLYYRPMFNGYSPTRWMFDRLEGLSPAGVPFLMYCFQSVFYKFRKHDPVSMHPLLYLFCRVVSPFFVKVNRSLKSCYNQMAQATAVATTSASRRTVINSGMSGGGTPKDKKQETYACGMTKTQLFIFGCFVLSQIPVGYFWYNYSYRSANEMSSAFVNPNVVPQIDSGSILDENGVCKNMFRNADAKGEHLALETFDSLKNCQMWCQTKDDCTWAVWQDPGAFLVCPGCCYLKTGKPQIVKNKIGWTAISTDCPLVSS